MQQEIWFQKYRIIKLLGSGGTARVYLAEHIKLNSYRAIKFISKNHPLYDLQHKEAFILKNLKHFCIPIIYDIEEDEYGSYIIEQYLEGMTLCDYVKEKGSLDEETIIHFTLQLCDLIHYLHSNKRSVLYLDLKPENIIITGSELKLIDFGSAVFLDEMKEGQDYHGTAGYAAPELYGRNLIDERCDVYSIGMLLYYMAAGYPVKENETNIENIDYISSCSRKLKNIINRCLKFNSSQRYASISDLSRDLSTALRKYQIHRASNRTVRFAIAGSQQRIGVTHFSFRICRFFKFAKINCLYLEKNLSRCIWSIKKRCEIPPENYEICSMNGIPMLERGEEEFAELSDYKVLVEDYGTLTKDNLIEFLQADVKLLLLGTKDWELTSTEEVLGLVKEQKDIIYLFNLVDGRQFQQAVKSMGKRKCFRIPYEPDPFAKLTERNGLDLFCELGSMAGYGKERHKIRKGVELYEKEANTF